MNTAPHTIHKIIVVRCELAAAFRTWTEQIGTWWPKGHSRSGDPNTLVMLEGYLAGRLYERTPDGAEHVWGKVIRWDPPHHLAYHWYLGSSAERPTRVDVWFRDNGDGRTRVEVTHRGPELVGELWDRTSTRFDAAWQHVLAAYAACSLLERKEDYEDV